MGWGGGVKHTLTALLGPIPALPPRPPPRRTHPHNTPGRVAPCGQGRGWQDQRAGAGQHLPRLEAVGARPAAPARAGGGAAGQRADRLDGCGAEVCGGGCMGGWVGGGTCMPACLPPCAHAAPLLQPRARARLASLPLPCPPPPHHHPITTPPPHARARLASLPPPLPAPPPPPVPTPPPVRAVQQGNAGGVRGGGCILHGSLLQPPGPGESFTRMGCGGWPETPPASPTCCLAPSPPFNCAPTAL